MPGKLVAVDKEHWHYRGHEICIERPPGPIDKVYQYHSIGDGERHPGWAQSLEGACSAIDEAIEEDGE